jgi:hypothetical protein
MKVIYSGPVVAALVNLADPGTGIQAVTVDTDPGTGRADGRGPLRLVRGGDERATAQARSPGLP